MAGYSSSGRDERTVSVPSHVITIESVIVMVAWTFLPFGRDLTAAARSLPSTRMRVGAVAWPGTLTDAIVS